VKYQIKFSDNNEIYMTIPKYPVCYRIPPWYKKRASFMSVKSTKGELKSAILKRCRGVSCPIKKELRS